MISGEQNGGTFALAGSPANLFCVRRRMPCRRDNLFGSLKCVVLLEFVGSNVIGLKIEMKRPTSNKHGSSESCLDCRSQFDASQ